MDPLEPTCHCLLVPPFSPCCHCRTIYCRDFTFPFPCILCWTFYHIITVHVATPHFFYCKQWRTPFISSSESSPSPSSSPSLTADRFFLSLPLCQSRLSLLPPLSDESPPSNHQLSSSSCSSPIFELHELSSCHIPITVLNVFFEPSPIFIS
jgi:hypothetical protein